MDPSSFELLSQSVDAQLRRLRQVLADVAKDQRGSTYLDFIDRHLAALEHLANAAASAFTGADAASKEFYGNKLSRVRYLLTLFHREVFEYRSDIGRNDLPSGLLHLVDHLIEDLLKASADPIIHLDGQYMYSTQRLVDRWATKSLELNVAWNEAVEPVIFNLPGLDPVNALLSPVLAHEVGHSVIQRNDLVSEVGARLDSVKVNDLEHKLLTDDPSANVSAAMQQFNAWAEELLCDALATELTGPSFAFSVAVFFPASSAGRSGPEHPDPAQRFDLALHQLDLNGWTPALKQRCPAIAAWLKGVSKTPPLLPVSPHEKMLRDLVDLAIPEIRHVAHDYVTASLDWSSYEPVEESMRTLIDAGVPPAELLGEPVSPWLVVTAMWLNAIAMNGDAAAALVSAVEDAPLSRFTLKTIEMSRVLQLWKDAHAATA